MASSGYSAFSGNRLIAFGSLLDVLRASKAYVDTSEEPRLLIFEDRTGRQIDFDFTGTVADVLARALPAPQRSGPGRPKLGVVSREVSLLPRHWEWLEAQQQGISAGLRRLVDEASKRDPREQRARKGREALSKFMITMAGTLANFEAANAALFASENARFEELIADWPEDIRAHLLRVLEESLALEAGDQE
jgi:uncharacterized protein